MCKIGFMKYASDLSLTDSHGDPYINSSRFRYAILENITDARFDIFSSAMGYAKWDKGRLFGETAELKWKKKGDLFHIVVTTDEEELPSGFTLFPGNISILGLRYIYLWGKQGKDQSGCYNGIWFDEKLPQFLKYPVKVNEDLAVMVLQEYEIMEEHEVWKDGKPKPETFFSVVYRLIRLEGKENG